MRKTALILITMGLLASCAKNDAKFCYKCTQKFTYKVKDSIPAHSDTTTTEYCDKTYKDIVTLEQANPGEETANYTSYQLQCEREQ
jgi:hypothetical protein